MAIQLRRGIFDRFDPTKLLPGEVAVVTSGDPDTVDGRSVYLCFSAGTTKRLATWEDMAGDLANAFEELEAEFSSDMATATTAANSAATAANASKAAADAAAVAANAAAQDATQAAEEARGAVSPDMRIYLTRDIVGNIDYPTIVDMTDE